MTFDLQTRNKKVLLTEKLVQGLHGWAPLICPGPVEADPIQTPTVETDLVDFLLLPSSSSLLLDDARRPGSLAS